MCGCRRVTTHTRTRKAITHRHTMLCLSHLASEAAVKATVSSRASEVSWTLELSVQGLNVLQQQNTSLHSSAAAPVAYFGYCYILLFTKKIPCNNFFIVFVAVTLFTIRVKLFLLQSYC